MTVRTDLERRFFDCGCACAQNDRGGKDLEDTSSTASGPPFPSAETQTLLSLRTFPLAGESPRGEGKVGGEMQAFILRRFPLAGESPQGEGKVGWKDLEWRGGRDALSGFGMQGSGS